MREWNNFSDIKQWRCQLLKNSRGIELERLRLKILDAVRISKRFWITFREGTFGIASIINLIYKKSFVEVLFFTNMDVIEKGVPLLKIYTPLEDEIDFDEILIEPDFDEDGLISPKKVIARMRRLILREFQNHLGILDQEIKLIDEHYENYAIDNIPSNREIRISYSNFIISLDINFERYPLPPNISFSTTLSKIISQREFQNQDIFLNWNINKPLHIVELIELLTNLVSDKLQINRLSSNSQFLDLSNVTIGDTIRGISLKIHRGKSLGIIYGSSEEGKQESQFDLLNLFESIKGSNKNFSGVIQLFGTPVQLISQEDLKKIFIIPEAYNAKIQKMKLRKAIKDQIDLKETFKSQKSNLTQILKNAGFTPSMDNIMGDLLTTETYRVSREKKFIKKAFEVTGLLNKKSKRFNELTPLEYFQFSIARTLIQSPQIIMFSIPPDLLGKLDFDKFNNYINSIKKKFHLVLLIHGPEDVISECDEILTINKKESNIGTYDQYINGLPSSGEVITVELDNPTDDLMGSFLNLKRISLILEERKNEKYKLYIKENPYEVLVDLTELFGSKLFSFRRSKATLLDYLDFKSRMNEIKVE
jgi:ABC-type transporter Mla maintaining outer membrane lipid asymmetry ATPase subunit MlaF